MSIETSIRVSSYDGCGFSTSNLIDYYEKYKQEKKEKEAIALEYSCMKKAHAELKKKVVQVEVTRILKSNNATIVFWNDGTKTIVKRAADEAESDYAAFTAALAIKCYGSNSALKRIVARTEEQKPKKKEAE